MWQLHVFGRGRFFIPTNKVSLGEADGESAGLLRGNAMCMRVFRALYAYVDSGNLTVTWCWQGMKRERERERRIRKYYSECKERENGVRCPTNCAI